MIVTAVVIFSCSSDEDSGATADREVMVVLKITANREIDMNTRDGGVNGDVNAKDGEFINTLCVFVVDADGVIEKKINPVLIGTNADKGNLYEYVSDAFPVIPGKKSFYAFANCDKLNNADLKEILEWKEGMSFGKDKVESIVIDNPASNIDPDKGQYIPMSNVLPEEDVFDYINVSNVIEIPLDRLVSRLRLTLQPNSKLEEDIPITGITIGGFADRVSLFPDGTLPDDVTYDEERLFKPTESDVVEEVKGFSAKNGHGFVDVYVNETRRNEPFTVEVRTAQYGSTVIYESSTARKELPRNSIFPINIKLSAMEPTLTAVMIAPPIGVVMEPIEPDFDGNTFTFKMYEGASFTITPEMEGTNNVAVKYEWTTDSDRNDISFTYNDEDTGVLSGTLSAIPNMDVTLGLRVKWTSGGYSYSRSYNVIIHADDLSNMKFAPSATGSLRLLPRETMFLWK